MKSFLTGAGLFSFTFALHVLVLPVPAAGQSQGFVPVANYAGGYAGNAYDFDSLAEAKKWVAKICDYCGLKPNFEVRPDPNIPSAEAVIEGTTRVIKYNPKFMKDIDSAAQTPWGSVSVLIHEIGHHLHGHTLNRNGGSHADELDADRFSGFVLQKMGASLKEATAAVRTLPQPASQSHPGRDERERAVEEGWNRSASLANGGTPGSQPVPTPVPSPQPVPPVVTPVVLPQPVQPRIVGRLVSYIDHRSFWITDNGQVIATDPWTGQTTTFGTRTAAFNPTQFAWDLVSPTERFGVTYDGRVIRFIGATSVNVGYVTGIQTAGNMQQLVDMR